MSGVTSGVSINSSFPADLAFTRTVCFLESWKANKYQTQVSDYS